MRHKQTPRLATIALTASWLASSASAQDGLGDARAIMPVVMLVVDTSGSMERVPVTEKVPECSILKPGEKNRWTGALEALTGTFPGYRCDAENRSGVGYTPSDYDYGYYLPHIVPEPAVLAAQTNDGVLDSLQASAKFGLMTFDGQPTYNGGDALIPLSDAKTTYLSRIGDTDPGPGSAVGAVYTGGSSGLYSYGTMKRLSFPKCVTDYGMNLGARGPGAPSGGLVSVGSSDDGNVVRGINADVQEALLSVRPYGGTPIAAVLDDLRYWLQNSPDLSYTPASGTTPAVGDPFSECRDKYALLLTDGAPDSMFRDTRYKCNSLDYAGGTAEGIGADLCAPDSGGTAKCECPYDRERDIAQSIVAFHDIEANASDKKEHDKLDRLFVVAFDVTDPDALDALDVIALAGNPDVNLAPLPANPTHAQLLAYAEDARADRVATTEQLRSKLISRIFDGGREKATSRTTPITIDGNAGSFVAAASSFEVRAGFKANSLPDVPWEGVLERSEILCKGTAIEYARETVAGLDDNKDKFHVALKAQSALGNRKVYTLKGSTVTLNVTSARGTLLGSLTDTLDTALRPAPLLSVAAYDGSTLGGGVSGVDANPPRAFVVDPFTTSSTLSPSFFGDADGNLVAGEAADRTRVARYLNGVAFSNSGAYALADIYHSNPVGLGPLVTSGVAPRLGNWRRELLSTAPPAGYATQGSRPQVVFVGTNDGLLHAFNLDDWKEADGTDRGPGYEFWSFFPPVLLDKVHNSAHPAPSHQFMFDGDIVVKDMFVNGGEASDPTPTLLATRTVLLAAVRGAPAYVALDVTNPEQAPGFLWQFAASTLGNTIAKPALTQISVAWNGTVQERAVAILPGGEGVPTTSGVCDAVTGSGYPRTATTAAIAPSDARGVGNCFTNQGRSLFIVDIATGTVIQEFSRHHFPAPISGGIGIDDTRPLSQSAYFSDEDGVLWHLGLDSTDPADWRVTPIWDVFHGKGWKDGRPSLYAPIVSRDRSGNDVVLLGTGDVDNLNDSAEHRVVSLTVRRSLSTVGSVTASSISLQNADGDVGEANWEITLEPGESVTGPLALLDSVVYFATFTAAASGSACDLGTSAVWGADYLQHAEGSTLPEGRMDTDDSEAGVSLALKKADGGNRVVLGLSVGKDPLCLTGTTQYNAITQSSGFVATGGPTATSFQIRANVGSMTSGSDVNSGSSIQGYKREQRTARRSRVVGWAGAVE